LHAGRLKSGAHFYNMHCRFATRFMPTFVTQLESALDGTRLPAGQIQSVHAGRPLVVRYDLAKVRAAVSPDELARRPPTLWRYRELLPLPLDVAPVTLGEGMTPLIDCPRLGEELGLQRLVVKDESQLHTGSFKSRGMTVAVSMARHFGIRRMAIPTAGNAGGALAAYAARAGIETFVFMPADTPRINQFEAALAGARVYLIDGLITDCGRIVRENAEPMQWFDMSTLREPYRLEGKKTMGLELAEQLDWRLPDVILYPTGGGTGLIGMWKAFAELRDLGWLGRHRPPGVAPAGSYGGESIGGHRSQLMPAGGGNRETSDGVKFPRMIACQSDGCAPIVKAFAHGERFAAHFDNAQTTAAGLRVPAAVGDFMILEAVRESGGCAIAGREDRIAAWMSRVAALEGICICPETAVCFDCLKQLIERGEIRTDDEVVVFNTGAAQKYPDLLPLNLPRIDPEAPFQT
jgi:threonine synthase